MPRDEGSSGRSRPSIFGALRQAVSGGTAFGGRGTVPEGRAERLGHPGPWPDALLSLLAGFREHVPPGARQQGA